MPLLHNVVAQLAAAPELMPRYSTIIMDINVFLVAGLVPNCLKVISDTVYIRSTSYEKQKEEMQDIPCPICHQGCHMPTQQVS